MPSVPSTGTPRPRPPTQASCPLSAVCTCLCSPHCLPVSASSKFLEGTDGVFLSTEPLSPAQGQQNTQRRCFTNLDHLQPPGPPRALVPYSNSVHRMVGVGEATGTSKLSGQAPGPLSPPPLRPFSAAQARPAGTEPQTRRATPGRAAGTCRVKMPISETSRGTRPRPLVSWAQSKHKLTSPPSLPLKPLHAPPVYS